MNHQRGHYAFSKNLMGYGIYPGISYPNIEEKLQQVDIFAINTDTTLDTFVNYQENLNDLFTSDLLSITGSITNINNSILNITGDINTIDNTLLLHQAEIDAIVVAGISAGNLDILYGVSIAVLDNTLTNNILFTTGALLSLDGRMDTQENLSISYGNRLDNLDSEVFNLGVTTGLSLIRLDNLEEEVNVNMDGRLTDIETYLVGNWELSTTGIDVPQTTLESIQDFSDKVNFAFQAINTIQWSAQAVQAIANGTFSTFITDQLGWNTANDGYQVLQDTEIATNSTNIGLLNTGLAVAVADILALNVASGILSTSSAQHAGDIDTLYLNDTLLGTSTTNLGVSYNSIYLSTTTAINTINSNITNLGTSHNSQQTTIDEYINRIDLTNPLNMRFKGATIYGVELSDTDLGITTNILARGNLTISGNLQSPLTNLIGTSISVLDNFRTTFLSTTGALLRNETTLPSSFINSSLTSVGILSSLITSGNITCSGVIQGGNFGVTSSSPNIHTSDYVRINSGGANSYLQFGNNTSSNYALIGTLSNNTFLRHSGPTSSILFQNSSASNIATFSNTQTSILNNQVNSLNLTISGTLQSPLTSLIGTSISVLDTYRTTMISTSMPQYLSRTETTLPSSFVSSSLTSVGTLSSLIVSGSATFNNLSTTGNVLMKNSVTINSESESVNSYLYLSNSNGAGNGLKTMIMSEAQTSWGRGKLHFCLNNNGTTFSTSQNATLNHSLMSLDYNGLLTTTGNILAMSNLTISGTLQSPLTSLIGTSIAVLDNFRTTYISTTGALLRNETTLPSSFINSSLTNIGSTSVNGIMINTSDWATINAPSVNSLLTFRNGFTTGDDSYIGMINDEMILENGVGPITLKPNGVEKWNIDTSGNVINVGNLTISGTLQSPLTSLIGTSIGILDTYRTTMISTSMPQYLSRTETTLPSSYLSSSLTSLGVLTSATINGNVGITGAQTITLNNANPNMRFLINTTSLMDIGMEWTGSLRSYIYSYTNRPLVLGVSGTERVRVHASGNVSFNNTDDTHGLKVSGTGLFTGNLNISGALTTGGALNSTGNIATSGTFYIYGNGNSMWMYPLNSTIGHMNTTNAMRFYANAGTPFLEGNNGWVGVNNLSTTGSVLIKNSGTINSESESVSSYLYLSNSNGAGNALKTMIASEAQTSWSRGKLHFCLNNDGTSNSTTQNATLSHSKMSLDYNGLLTVSGNANVKGTLTTTGAIDATGSNIMRGSDALELTHTGNCSLKVTGGSYTYRYETQTNDEHFLWDGANNEVYHISGDNQIWFQSDVNCAGTYYDSGLPLTPSSKLIKGDIKNMKDLENKVTILDKIDFKKYKKTYKGNTYDEVGIIIEDLEEIEGIEDYNLIHTRENKSKGGEYDGLKYLKYVPFFMILFNELKDEINDLKNQLKK